MWVEPTGGGGTRRPPVLKTVAVTGRRALPRKSKAILFQRLADVGRHTFGPLPSFKVLSFKVLDMIIALARGRRGPAMIAKRRRHQTGTVYQGSGRGVVVVVYDGRLDGVLPITNFQELM